MTYAISLEITPGRWVVLCRRFGGHLSLKYGHSFSRILRCIHDRVNGVILHETTTFFVILWNIPTYLRIFSPNLSRTNSNRTPAYCFLICWTALSVFQTTWLWITDEWSKDSTRSWSRVGNIPVDTLWLEKKMRNVSRYIRCLCRDSNRAPSKYKSRKTQSHHPFRW